MQCRHTKAADQGECKGDRSDWLQERTKHWPLPLTAYYRRFTTGRGCTTARALSINRKNSKDSSILALPMPYPRNLPPPARKAFTPWSSPLGGRLRTISAGTNFSIRYVEVPSSDHGDRSSKKKPAEPRCSLRHLSDHRGIFLMAPRIVPEQLMGCPESGRKDRINLNIFFERTQGHFLSPCLRHGSLCTKQPR